MVNRGLKALRGVGGRRHEAVIGIMLVAAWAIVFACGYGSLVKARASESWSAVEGTIRSSRVKEEVGTSDLSP